MNLQEFSNMNTEQRLNKTVAFVEATSFEKLSLWKEWSKEYGAVEAFFGREKERVKWEEVLSGTAAIVGYVEDYPVCISLCWDLIEGHPVLFWCPTSIRVNHDLIDDWLKKNLPNVFDEQRRAQDAMNFHIIVHGIAKLNKEITPS